MNKELLLKVSNIVKSYQQGNGELPILKGIDLELHTGDALSIQGVSGAGKSTLMHILGTLDRPQTGEINFDGRDVMAMKDEELARFRNDEMGFVFQFHHLIAEFSALENVCLPNRSDFA